MRIYKHTLLIAVFSLLSNSLHAENGDVASKFINNWVDSWNANNVGMSLSTTDPINFIKRNKGREILEIVEIDRVSNIRFVSTALKEKYRDKNTGGFKKLMISYALAYFLYGEADATARELEILANNLRFSYLTEQKHVRER